jgi:hypothetical protein
VGRRRWQPQARHHLPSPSFYKTNFNNGGHSQKCVQKRHCASPDGLQQATQKHNAFLIGGEGGELNFHSLTPPRQKKKSVQDDMEESARGCRQERAQGLCRKELTSLSQSAPPLSLLSDVEQGRDGRWHEVGRGRTQQPATMATSTHSRPLPSFYYHEIWL